MAALIQTFFDFNLLFPDDLDYIFLFVRIACNYQTKEDGAKNKNVILARTALPGLCSVACLECPVSTRVKISVGG